MRKLSEGETVVYLLEAMNIDDIKSDLELTKLDIERLEAITANIDGFMRDNGGEDRAALRVDYLKYSSLLDHCRGLLRKIESAYATALRS